MKLLFGISWPQQYESLFALGRMFHTHTGPSLHTGTRRTGFVNITYMAESCGKFVSALSIINLY